MQVYIHNSLNVSTKTTVKNNTPTIKPSIHFQSKKPESNISLGLLKLRVENFWYMTAVRAWKNFIFKQQKPISSHEVQSRILEAVKSSYTEASDEQRLLSQLKEISREIDGLSPKSKVYKAKNIPNFLTALQKEVGSEKIPSLAWLGRPHEMIHKGGKPLIFIENKNFDALDMLIGNLQGHSYL